MSNNKLKDAYYFSHDSNAKDDFKCMHLIEELGLEGYGIFWVLIETLREQEQFTYPIRFLSSLARKYNTTQAKMEVVVRNYNLFIIDNDTFFFSESLNKRMSLMHKQREQRRLAGIKSGEARKNKKIERSLNGRSTDAEQLKEKKEKERKEKEKKEIDKFLNKKIILKKFIKSRNVTDEFLYRIHSIQEVQEDQYQIRLEDIHNLEIEQSKTLLTYDQVEAYISQNQYIENENLMKD